jgi:hypothetical protein
MRRLLISASVFAVLVAIVALPPRYWAILLIAVPFVVVGLFITGMVLTVRWILRGRKS